MANRTIRKPLFFFCVIALLVTMSVVVWKKRQAATVNQCLVVGPKEVRLTAESGGLRQSVGITLENRCEGVVVVTGIETSCGCTVPATTNSISIQPGDHVTVPVKVQLPAEGQKVSRVNFRDSDGKSHVVKFYLSGKEPEIPRLVSPLQRKELVRKWKAAGESEEFLEFTTAEFLADEEKWVEGVCMSDGQVVPVSCIREEKHESYVIRTYQAKLTEAEPNLGERFSAARLVITGGVETSKIVAYVRVTPATPFEVLPKDIVLHSPAKQTARFIVRTSASRLPAGLQVTSVDPRLRIDTVKKSDSTWVMQVSLTDQILSGDRLSSEVHVAACDPDIPVEIVKILVTGSKDPDQPTQEHDR